MASVNDIAVDLGTSRTLIYIKGFGIKLEEPSVVAIDRDTRDVIAIGKAAHEMLGRTPSHILALRPLRDGTISDYELVSYMLKNFVQQAVGRHLFGRPKAILCLPTGVSDVERRSLLSTMFDAGMRRTQILNRSLAAALGAGLDIAEPKGSLIVDISAGVTDIAVVAGGRVEVEDSLTDIGGSRFDDAIIRYLRRKQNFLIGERAAEALKCSIGSAVKREKPSFMEVTGRSMLTSLPRNLRITSADIEAALDEPVQKLIEAIQSVLEHTPAELAADIYERGITLSGGGAKLFGLCEAISEALRIPCTCGDEPQTDVVMGGGITLENMHELGRYLDDGRRRFGR